MRRTLGLMVLMTGLQACASQPAYVPDERARATLSGRTAAAYALPSEQAPRGDIRLASEGVTKLTPNGRDSMRAIHLSMAVSDIGHEPIVLDAREQLLQLPDGRRIGAAYVRSAVDLPPLIRVEPGTAQTVDLYFPIPADLLDKTSPPRFDVVWTVDVGGDTVTEVTPFDKVAVDPAKARLAAAKDEAKRNTYVVDRSPVIGLPMGVGGW